MRATVLSVSTEENPGVLTWLWIGPEPYCPPASFDVDEHKNWAMYNKSVVLIERTENPIRFIAEVSEEELLTCDKESIRIWAAKRLGKV